MTVIVVVSGKNDENTRDFLKECLSQRQRKRIPSSIHVRSHSLEHAGTKNEMHNAITRRDGIIMSLMSRVDLFVSDDERRKLIVINKRKVMIINKRLLF